MKREIGRGLNEYEEMACSPTWCIKDVRQEIDSLIM